MRVYEHPGTRNFGDTLSRPILSHFVGGAVELAERKERGKVLAVGSIMTCLRPGDFVWGTGVQEDQAFTATGATFLAVRGPITRSCVDGVPVPEIYGDPGLLLPLVYDPDVEPVHDLGVVPHFVDAGISKVDRNRGVFHISVHQPWEDVVRQIKSCRRIITTSLHGIVVAEAYGIPVMWHRSYSGAIRSPNLKFQDYFMGTGREPQRPGVLDPLPRDVWQSMCARLVERAKLLPA
jgi:pyruvyltransferase